MSIQIFNAVATINKANITCNTLVFIFLPAIAPSGDAIKLATIMINSGKYSICPVVILPTAAPIEEINVIAKENAIVILVGIFNTTSIIWTNKNAPAAPIKLLN
jgi:hypothetical protein